MFDYVNVIYWVIALGVVAGVGQVRHVPRRGREQEPRRPERAALETGCGRRAVCDAAGLFVHAVSFWIALPLNALIVAGVVMYYGA